MKLLEIKSQLLIALVVSIASYFFSPSLWHLSTRLVFAWDVGVASWLVMVGLMMINATPQKMRYQAQRWDASGLLMLILVVASACASLLAIVLMLQQGKGLSESRLTLHLSLSLVTIVLSWLLIHTMFAVHYAHLYYQMEELLHSKTNLNSPKALEFPQEQQPDYGDFIYFSWGIGMTCQVSDVQITSRLLRRLALVHQLLTFFFNTVILALGINLLASII